MSLNTWGNALNTWTDDSTQPSRLNTWGNVLNVWVGEFVQIDEQPTGGFTQPKQTSDNDEDDVILIAMSFLNMLQR